MVSDLFYIHVFVTIKLLDNINEMNALFGVSVPEENNILSSVGMTVMAKVITTSEICENAKMARDMALAGK